MPTVPRPPHGPIDTALALIYAAADHPTPHTISQLEHAFPMQAARIKNYEHRQYLEAVAHEVLKGPHSASTLKRAADELERWQTRVLGHGRR